MLVSLRFSLPIMALVLATLAVGTRAEAQNYPWCAQYSGDMGGAMNCGFSTYAQCMATVSGIGGFCMTNNRYQPPVSMTPRQTPRRHAGSDS